MHARLYSLQKKYYGPFIGVYPLLVSTKLQILPENFEVACMKPKVPMSRHLGYNIKVMGMRTFSVTIEVEQ